MQAVETENFVPVDYDETDNARMSRPPALKEGLFKTAITAVERGDDIETKNLYLALVLAPLNGADAPQSPTARKRVELPLRNPKVVGGHTVADLASVTKNFKKFIQAVDPQALSACPSPKKAEDGKYYNASGAMMTKIMWDEHNGKVNDILLTKAKTWYNEPNQLVGAVCYTFIKRNEQYSNVYYMTSEPGSHTVITEKFTA